MTLTGSNTADGLPSIIVQLSANTYARPRFDSGHVHRKKILTLSGVAMVKEALGKKILTRREARDMAPNHAQARYEFYKNIVLVGGDFSDVCSAIIKGRHCKSTPTTLVKKTSAYGTTSYYLRCDEHKSFGDVLSIAKVNKGRVSI